MVALPPRSVAIRFPLLAIFWIRAFALAVNGHIGIGPHHHRLLRLHQGLDLAKLDAVAAAAIEILHIEEYACF